MISPSSVSKVKAAGNRSFLEKYCAVKFQAYSKRRSSRYPLTDSHSNRCSRISCANFIDRTISLTELRTVRTGTADRASSLAAGPPHRLCVTCALCRAGSARGRAAGSDSPHAPPPAGCPPGQASQQGGGGRRVKSIHCESVNHCFGFHVSSE